MGGFDKHETDTKNMIKTAIYVDAENIKMSGGFGMRYDVLLEYAGSGDSTVLRANCYLAEDHDRIKTDPEYRQKTYGYHNILRQCGFRVIKKFVRRFRDEEGNVSYKANSDMDLAIDALHQCRNTDRVILLTGDSDFARLVQALQNQGCRVEVIGFNNVGKELREVADSYISGFLIPGLLPISGGGGEEWLRGSVANYNPDRGFGFFRYFRRDAEGLHPESVFFHNSQATMSTYHFLDLNRVFEFYIGENAVGGDDRSEAKSIRLCGGDDRWETRETRSRDNGPGENTEAAGTDASAAPVETAEPAENVAEPGERPAAESEGETP